MSEADLAKIRERFDKLRRDDGKQFPRSAMMGVLSDAEWLAEVAETAIKRASQPSWVGTARGRKGA